MKDVLGLIGALILKLLISLFPKKQDEPKPAPKPLPPSLLSVAMQYRGKDASPKNLAPQELSCAEGVSNIIHEWNPAFPSGVLNTARLAQILDASPHFERTTIPKAGCVIVSPRVGETPGHAGFFTEPNWILSNDSRTGKMEVNYSLDSWIRVMRHGRGLRILIWQPND